MRKAGFGLLPAVLLLIVACILLPLLAVPEQGSNAAPHESAGSSALMVIDRFESGFAILVAPPQQLRSDGRRKFTETVEGGRSESAGDPSNTAAPTPAPSPVFVKRSKLEELAGRPLAEGDFVTIRWTGPDMRTILDAKLEEDQTRLAREAVAALLENLARSDN